MNTNGSSIGIALMCDNSGHILRVLQNDLDITEAELVGRQLPAVFGSYSFAKAMSFLNELQKNGRFFNCELVLPVNDLDVRVDCAGLSFDSGLLVLAVVIRAGLEDLFEGLLKVNNDQATLLRLATKEVVQLDLKPEAPNIDFFDEMTHTNNELVSLQRELHQKNAQLVRLTAEVQALARTDELTGFLNRRGFFQLGNREVALARQFKKPLAAIMLDIDHFKAFNDTYGHAIGDQVLVGVSERCRSAIRDVDVFGRYGGEEFSILLPESGSEAGKTTAEKMRVAVEGTAFETDEGPLHVTISLGVACLNHRATGLDDLLEEADSALYRAKAGGRNRVELANHAA